MAREKSSGSSVEEMLEAFRQKRFKPVLLFTGEEDFLIDQAVGVLLTEALDESSKSFNLDIVYGSDADVKDVAAMAAAYPMMAERRVVIVKDFDKLANKDALVSYLEHPSETTVLALLSAKPDYRLKVFKVLKDQGAVVEAKPLYEDAIPGWIENRIKKLGKKISPDAARLMQSYVGKSLRALNAEIEKILTFVGKADIITVDDINAVVGMTKQHNIFELQKAIGQKQIEKAQDILERMLGMGESPLGMIVMIQKYFEKLWVFTELRQNNKSELHLAGALRVSPYFLKDYIDASHRYHQREVEHSFLALRDADMKLKTSGGEPLLVMTLLLHCIINGNTARTGTPALRATGD